MRDSKNGIGNLVSSFSFWSEYWGHLLTDGNSENPVTVYGFENQSTQNSLRNNIDLVELGTVWGFVQSGEINFMSSVNNWVIKAGQWFCIQDCDSRKIILAANSKLFLVFSKEHKGLNSMGGPIESYGRLRYIDNCTDTILYSPPIKGDPCLNFLHFPCGVNQTAHFHPSSRFGIVVSGRGVCEVENDNYSLEPGKIFYLPANAFHKFRTKPLDCLNVITFHPESDYGPTHEVHPMINRTWFDSKILK